MLDYNQLLYTTIITIITSTFVSKITLIFNYFMSLILSIFFNSYTMNSTDIKFQILLDWIKENGCCWSSIIQYNVSLRNDIDDGIYLIYFNKKYIFINYFGYLKDLHMYIPKIYKYEITEIFNDFNNMTNEQFITYSSNDKYFTTMRIKFPIDIQPKKWQFSILQSIKCEHNFSSRIILISGKPGIGKTSIGQFIARKLINNNFRPYLSNHTTMINLSSISSYNKGIEIFVIDEFDLEILQSEKGFVNNICTDKSDSTNSIINKYTRSPIMQTLDVINKTTRLIVILTTNINIDILHTEKYGNGRCTDVIQLDDDENIESWNNYN